MINLKDHPENWKILIGICVLLCHHLFGNFKKYTEFKALHFALYFSTFCILWNFLLEVFQSKKFLRLVLNFTLYVLLSFSLINFSNELDFDSNLLLYLLSNRAIIMFVHQTIDFSWELLRCPAKIFSMTFPGRVDHLPHLLCRLKI